MLLKAVVLSAFMLVESRGADLGFHPGFKFGAATAAYQLEGAWNVSDKGESIWDRYTHTRAASIADSSSGDVACDSYHQWRRDVQIAKELGLHFYRFSINWPRLLPSGFPDRISEDGRNYYSDLIDELLRNGIEPVVTIYHWELPQRLQDLGGWINPLIADWFADYSRVVYSLYGNRVKTWLTINEPLAICDLAYNFGILAPGLPDPDVSNYICTKNVLLAHAKAWRVYDEEFRAKYRGRVTLANQLLWLEPVTLEDDEIAELARAYYTGRFTHPVFSKEGGWPPALEKIVAENSRRQGYPRSRLPAFSQEEINMIRDTFDFFGLNHYTSRLVRKARPDEEVPNWPLGGVPEISAVLQAPPDWKAAYNKWLLSYPQGLRRQLAWLKRAYGDIDILITENGYPTAGHDLDDGDRVEYIRDYLEQVLLAIKEDGVNVTGYTAWSLIDNFEWMDGYNTKFGLYEVDFASPERTRTARRSARYYAQIIQRHSLGVPETLLGVDKEEL